MGRRILALGGFALGLLAAGLACDKVTPVAPSGSTITLSINPTRIAARNETAEVTAIVRKEDGTPVNPKTLVNFSTTLGTIDPEVAETDIAGVAKSRLIGDGRIGTATVSASTGAAALVSEEVQVGSAAASITLNATPTDVALAPQGTDCGPVAPPCDKITVVALVRDDTGAPLADVVVNFEADVGTVSPLTGRTDDDGQVESFVYVTQGNLSILLDPFFEVRAQVAIAGGNLIEDIVPISIRDVPTDILLQATPTTVPTSGGTIELLCLVFDNLGRPIEGVLVNFLTELGRLGSRGSSTPTNAMGEARDTLTVSSTDTAGLSGQTFRVRAQAAGFGGVPLEDEETVRIQSLVPVAAFTFTPPAPSVGLPVNFTFTGSGGEPLSFAWDFDGDGTTDSTARNPSFTYSTTGSKTVRLTVSNAFGPPSVASATFTVS